MAYQTILFDPSEGVARLTLNRPDRLNSFTVAMHEEVADALTQVERDATVRAMLLTAWPCGRTVCVIGIRGCPGALSCGFRASDGANFTTVEAARRKAVAASALRTPISALVEMFGSDQLVLTALASGGEMMGVPGGFRLMAGSDCRGGFCMAGGHYTKDELIGPQALAKI